MVLGHFQRACALLATALILVACQDDAERLAEHQKRAEAYLEEEKYAEAIIEFKEGRDPLPWYKASPDAAYAFSTTLRDVAELYDFVPELQMQEVTA